MDAQTFLDNFATIAEAPGGVQRLRELVLDLAVRGQLVEQDPTEGPAEMLLEHIAEERAALISNGRLRQQKNRTLSREPCPPGWVSVDLGTVLDLEYGKALPAKARDATGTIPVFGSNGIVGFHSEALVSRACVIVGRKGSAGAVNVSLEPSWPIDTTYFVEPRGGMSVDYVALILQTSRLDELDRATAVPGLNREEAYSIPVLLPPLAEQERIVAKVDELMALCDKLEARQQRRHRATTRFRGSALHALAEAETPEDLRHAWERVSTNWPALTGSLDAIDSLRQTVVQLAVRGHLVTPAAPAAGAADELVEATRKRRAEVDKERVLRGPKHLSAINEVPKPFSLPTGWTWARFSDLGELARGRSQHRPRNDPMLYTNGTVPLVQTGNVARAVGTIHTWSAAYNDVGLAQSRLWPAGTLCITIAANIADSAVLGFDACFPDSVVGFLPFEPIQDARYFEYFMRTAQSDLELFAPSTAQKNINLSILDQLLIPLPPADEMVLIVQRVEALLDLCDVLETRQLRRGTASAAAAASLVHVMAR